MASHYRHLEKFSGWATRTFASYVVCLGHAQAQAACKVTPPKLELKYQDFLTLWKDADPDIPILVAAKAEYAKLR